MAQAFAWLRAIGQTRRHGRWRKPVPARMLKRVSHLVIERAQKISRLRENAEVCMIAHISKNNSRKKKYAKSNNSDSTAECVDIPTWCALFRVVGLPFKLSSSCSFARFAIIAFFFAKFSACSFKLRSFSRALRLSSLAAASAAPASSFGSNPPRIRRRRAARASTPTG